MDNSEFSKKIINHLVQKNEEAIDKLIEIEMLLEMLPTKDLIEWLLVEINISYNGVTKLLKTRRSLDTVKDYDLELKILSSIKVNEGNYLKNNNAFIESICNAIPAKELINQDVIKKIIDNNSVTVQLFPYKLLKTLSNKPWFVDLCLDNNISLFRLYREKFQLNDIEKAKKAITNNVKDLKCINPKLLQDVEILNIALDNLAPHFKKGKVNKNVEYFPQDYKDILSLSKLLADSLLEDSDNKKIQLYAGAFPAIGVVVGNFTEAEVIQSLESRMELLKKIKKVYAPNLNVIDFLISDLDDKQFTTKVFEKTINLFKDYLATPKMEGIGKLSLSSLLYKCSKYPNDEIKKMTKNFDSIWKSNASVIYANDFNLIERDLQKVSILLLEEQLLKDTPINNIKNNMRKF